MYEIPTVKVQLVREGAPIRVRTPDVAAKVAQQVCCGSDPTVERFAVLCLDGASQVRNVKVVAMGGRGQLCLTIAEVFKPAILAGASAIVVAHNHPSGDPTPSPEDLTMTRKLVEAGEVLGITVVDHVVVTDDGRSHSMLEAGQL